MFLFPNKVELEERSLERAMSVQALSQHWQVWIGSIFLVTVPVFLEAPLVRYAPWLSLICTIGWLRIAKHLQNNSQSQTWGNLIWGFSLTWLCGSLYWGWLRWEPLYHVPVEALALPWAIAGIRNNSHRIGGWFYIGSLCGTAATDLYFYITDLFPHWQALMQVEADLSLAKPILKSAVLLVETTWGITWACIFAAILLIIGNKSMRSPHLGNWAFGGAILGTIFVDLLFFSAALAN